MEQAGKKRGGSGAGDDEKATGVEPKKPNTRHPLRVRLCPLPDVFEVVDLRVLEWGFDPVSVVNLARWLGSKPVNKLYLSVRSIVTLRDERNNFFKAWQLIEELCVENVDILFAISPLELQLLNVRNLIVKGRVTWSAISNLVSTCGFRILLEERPDDKIPQGVVLDVGEVRFPKLFPAVNIQTVNTTDVAYIRGQLSTMRDYFAAPAFTAAPWDGVRNLLQEEKIAVLDSGIDLFHPDLTTSVVEGRSFVPGSEWWVDKTGHGTHCAGVLVGEKTGIAFGAKLIVGQVENVRGLAEAINWAVGCGATVISISIGVEWFSYEVYQACLAAASAGVTIVAAAGNEGRRDVWNVRFPASVATVISVGSVSPLGHPSLFSSVGGRQVDFSVPGEAIWSTWPHYLNERSNHVDLFGRTYRAENGTSMATPAVAALCAVLRSAAQSLGLPGFGMLGRLNEHQLRHVLRSCSATHSPTSIFIRELAVTPSLLALRVRACP